MKEGTSACPPIPPLRLSDDDAVPVRGLSHRAELTATGVQPPLSVSLVKEHFSGAMKYHFKIPGYQMLLFHE